MAEKLARDDAATFLVKVGGGLALIALFLFGGLWFIQSYIHAKVDPSPVTVASASIEGLREQNKLSAFQARFVAVVTSKQSRLGMSTERTTIMPGTVDYEVDLSKLTDRDVVWDAKTKTLGITLPPVTASAPRIDVDRTKSYGRKGVLGTFTDATTQLDETNRLAAQKELSRQAYLPEPMKLAQEAARRSVERSFSMPLKAVGVEATVRVRFSGEGKNDEVWDMSTPVDGVNYNKK